MKRTHAGFTALELLIVIGIIGIIIAIALVGLTRARQKSRDDSRISNMRIVQMALEDFKTACRNYPNALNPAADNCMFAQGSVTFKDFLSQIPANPNSTPFLYYAYANASDPTQCIGYHLAVELEMQNHGAFANDSDFNSASGVLQNIVPCTTTLGSQQPFDGGNDQVNRLYDIRR